MKPCLHTKPTNTNRSSWLLSSAPVRWHHHLPVSFAPKSTAASRDSTCPWLPADWPRSFDNAHHPNRAGSISTAAHLRWEFLQKNSQAPMTSFHLSPVDPPPLGGQIEYHAKQDVAWECLRVDVRPLHPHPQVLDQFPDELPRWATGQPEMLCCCLLYHSCWVAASSCWSDWPCPRWMDPSSSQTHHGRAPGRRGLFHSPDHQTKKGNSEECTKAWNGSNDMKSPSTNKPSMGWT